MEDRFLLLGYSDSIQLIDLHNMQKPKTIIWLRARQMVVIESCRVVLILAGRYKQVRCYSFDALLRLIYAVLGLDWSQRKEIQYDIPTHQQWDHVSSQSGKVPDEDQPDDPPPSNESSDSCSNTHTNYDSPIPLNLKERLVKKREEKMSSKPALTIDHQLTIAGLTKSYYVYHGIILQDFYYKLPDSKDALGIQTYQTSTYVFAAVRHRDKIVLWQRRRDHPLRPFYRLKVFWIPTEAKAISFADDRSTLRHIVAVFSSEATVIELRNSKVQTVPIDPTLERIYQTTWARDQYERQLSSPRSPHSPIPTTMSRLPPPQDGETYPTLPASLSVPPIQWTSLIQLPFYPDSLPATTLTTDYSIPPSYSTVVTSLPSAAPDPVALPSASAPQLFFATVGKQSYMIDLTGALFSTQVYRWSEVPVHIEFIQLDHTVNDWCVVGFGSETVEIIHIKTAETVQRVMHGVPVKFLGRWDEYIPRPGKKSKIAFKSIFWSCAAANERIHVYMLKSEL
jgi:hypothetical protein